MCDLRFESRPPLTIIAPISLPEDSSFAELDQYATVRYPAHAGILFLLYDPYRGDFGALAAGTPDDDLLRPDGGLQGLKYVVLSQSDIASACSSSHASCLISPTMTHSLHSPVGPFRENQHDGHQRPAERTDTSKHGIQYRIHRSLTDQHLLK